MCKERYELKPEMCCSYQSVTVVTCELQDRKTALFWAVEKSHVGVVKSILAANPDLELATKVRNFLL